MPDNYIWYVARDLVKEAEKNPSTTPKTLREAQILSAKRDTYATTRPPSKAYVSDYYRNRSDMYGQQPQEAKLQTDYGKTVSDVFPEYNVSQIGTFMKNSPQTLLGMLKQKGQNPQTEAFFKAFYPGQTQDAIDAFFKGTLINPSTMTWKAAPASTVPYGVLNPKNEYNPPPTPETPTAPSIPVRVASAVVVNPVAQKVAPVLQTAVDKITQTLKSANQSDAVDLLGRLFPIPSPSNIKKLQEAVPVVEEGTKQYFSRPFTAAVLVPLHAALHPEDPASQTYLQELAQHTGLSDRLLAFTPAGPIKEVTKYLPGTAGVSAYENMAMPKYVRGIGETVVETLAMVGIGYGLGGAKWAEELPKPIRWFLNIPEKGIPKVNPADLTAAQLVFGETAKGLNTPESIIDFAMNPDKMRALGQSKAFAPLAKILGGLSATAKTPTEIANVAADWLATEGRARATLAMSAATRRIGPSSKIFDLDADLNIKSGFFKGQDITDVLRHAPTNWEHFSLRQQEWITGLRKVTEGRRLLYEANDIPLELRNLDEGMEYFGAKVVYKTDPVTGELIDRGVVSGGKMPGAKPGFTKHEVFANKAEAKALGYHYLPPEEAAALNLTAAYKYIGQKMVYQDYLLPKLGLRTTAAPEELRLAAEAASSKLDTAKAMLTTLSRAIRGGREQLSPNMSKFFPDESAELRGVINQLKQGGETADAVQSLTAKLKANLGVAQTENARAIGARASAREFAMTAHYSEATVRAPIFSGKILTGPEAQAVADSLNEQFRVSQVDSLLKAVDKVNSAARLFALAGDVSQLTIQLLMVGGSHPVAYAKAIGGTVKAIFDSTYHDKYLADNITFLQKWAGAGLLLSRNGTEFTEALAKGGFFRTGIFKYMGKGLAPFQRGFETALDVAGTEMAKSFDYLGTNPQRMSQIAAFVNEYRGLADTGRLGISQHQRAVESAFILAPRYGRAIGALFVDMFRGNLRGNLAGESMARFVGSASAMTVAVSLALGEDFDTAANHLQPAVYDPNRGKWIYNSKFMTWQIGGVNVGPGSKVRSLIAMWAKMDVDPESLTKWGMTSFLQNDNPFLAFVKSNFSPGISTGIDVLSGRNYIGDPTRDSLPHIAKTLLGENLLPMTVQSILFDGGDLQAKVLNGTAQFIGMRSYALTPSNIRDNRRDQLSVQTYDKPWAGLDLKQRQDLRTAYPELVSLDQQASSDWAKRNPTDKAVDYSTQSQEIISRYKLADQTTTYRVQNGAITTKDARGQWADNGNDKSVEMTNKRNEFKAVVDEAQKNQSNGMQQPFDICYEDWITRIMSPNWEDPNTGKFDYAGYQDAIETFKKDWGDKFYNEVQTYRDTANDYDPLHLFSKDSAQVWKGYYDTQDADYRINTRRANPDVEARLIFWGQLSSSFENPQAIPLVLDYMKQYAVPTASVPMFLNKPEKYTIAQQYMAEQDPLKKQLLAKQLLSPAAYNEIYSGKPRLPVGTLK